MRCTIDGQPIDLALLLVRPMNFGQPVPQLQPLGYELTLGLDELSPMFGQPYGDWRDDARQHPDPDDELEQELRGQAWPTLEDLGQRHSALLARLLQRFGYDLLLDLERAFGPGRAPALCLNSVDRVVVDGATIVLQGQAYRYEASGVSPQASGSRDGDS